MLLDRFDRHLWDGTVFSLVILKRVYSYRPDRRLLHYTVKSKCMFRLLHESKPIDIPSYLHRGAEFV